jgi:CheY-like chemotaxis protein
MSAAIYNLSGHGRNLPHVRKKPHRPSVLVVDDEDVVLEMVQDILADEGFVVMTASDGGLALSMAKQAQPELIITDLMMPGMNGRALRERLKAEPHTARIPVLLMSAAYHVQPGDDFAGVIHKPFDIDDFLHHVHQHMVV